MPTVSRPNAVPSNRCASDAAPMQRLAECQSEFLRFLRRRMSCPDDAEDVFQDFCVKVLRATKNPGTTDTIDAWLRHVLRNTLIDYYRRRATRHRVETAYEAEASEPTDQPRADQPENPCCCVQDLVPTLRPDYAEIVRRADLEEEPRERIAADLALTSNNVGVRLHRARRSLREKIGERRPTCCGNGFRNCDCGPATGTKNGRTVYH